ncbi:CBS domain-containing protein [Bradyrhizobium pachyrhizi]|uniref:CBS domain-containing protein n=1 Tax=Bradyrhizobium pachyrhizi TaxID=280333 RepID=UPI000B32BFD8
MGPSTWDCFGGDHGDQRSFAGRPYCAAGSAPGRRRASSRGHCPIHLEGPPLLLVQQGMARRRLVSVWFWFKARHGLGWSGGMARMATARPPPGHSASETWAARNPASATTPATASRQELMAALSVVRRPRRCGARHRGRQGPKAKVRDAMTDEVKYCFEDEDISHVCTNMSDIQVRRLPVMDRDKRLVGIVSRSDLTQHSPATGRALHGSPDRASCTTRAPRLSLRQSAGRGRRAAGMRAP